MKLIKTLKKRKAWKLIGNRYVFIHSIDGIPYLKKDRYARLNEYGIKIPFDKVEEGLKCLINEIVKKFEKIDRFRSILPFFRFFDKYQNINQESVDITNKCNLFKYSLNYYGIRRLLFNYSYNNS